MQQVVKQLMSRANKAQKSTIVLRVLRWRRGVVGLEHLQWQKLTEPLPLVILRHKSQNPLPNYYYYYYTHLTASFPRQPG